MPRLGTLLYLNSNERGVDSLSWTLGEISDCLGRKPVPCFGNASPFWPFHNLYLGLIGIKMVPTSPNGVLNTTKVINSSFLVLPNMNFETIYISHRSSSSPIHHHHQFVPVVLWRLANCPYPIHLIL